ncbi:MAG: hypothetical protein AAF409_11355 [Pseudomonadota bacterium]
MSKKSKLLSAAVAGGLAVASGHTAQGAVPGDDMPGVSETDLGAQFFGGDGTSDPLLGDMLGERDLEPMEIQLIDIGGDNILTGEGDGDFQLAQTVYGGTGDDRVLAPRGGQIQGGAQIQRPGVEAPVPGKQLQPRTPKVPKAGKIKRQ